MIKNNKDAAFNSLLSSVDKCDICPRMCNRKKVLSQMNGNINSKVVFIAEAPGRLGAECTGIPLYGDVTGNNFETLLSNIGWTREDIFIKSVKPKFTKEDIQAYMDEKYKEYEIRICELYLLVYNEEVDGKKVKKNLLEWKVEFSSENTDDYRINFDAQTGEVLDVVVGEEDY